MCLARPAFCALLAAALLGGTSKAAAETAPEAARTPRFPWEESGLLEIEGCGGTRTLSISSDGRLLAMAGSSSCARVHELLDGKLRHVISGGMADCYVAVFAPDGKQFAAGGIAMGDYGRRAGGGVLGLWDAGTGERTAGLVSTKDEEVMAAAYSADGRYLAVALRFRKDKTIYSRIELWDAVRHRKVRSFKPCEGVIMSLTTSSNSKLLAFVIMVPGQPPAGRVVVRQLPRGKQRALLKEEKRVLFSAAISPDGRHIAAISGSTEKREALPTVDLWDVKAGKKIRTVELEGILAAAVAFSPDGKQLAIGYGRRDNDSVLGGFLLVDFQSGQEIARVEGHRCIVTCVAFSKDGGLVATGGQEKKIGVWLLAKVDSLSRSVAAVERFKNKIKELEKAGKSTEMIAELGAAVVNESPEIRLLAAQKLAAAPESGAVVEPLATATRDADARVRTAAINGLRALGSKAAGAASALRRSVTDDPDRKVRGLAALALADIDPAAAREVKALLREILGDRTGDSYERKAAARALGIIGRLEGGIPPELMAATTDDDWIVRDRAIEAVGDMEAAASAAIRPFAEMVIKSKDVKVRVNAAVAMGKIGNVPADLLPLLVEAYLVPNRPEPKDPMGSGAWDQYEINPIRKAVGDTLIKIGPRVVPHILKRVLADKATAYMGSVYADVFRGIGAGCVPYMTKVIEKRLDEGGNLYPHHSEIYTMCKILQELGPAAKDAAPVLRRFLAREPDSYSGKAALKAVTSSR